MTHEFNALQSQGTCDLVLPPPNCNIMGCKWSIELNEMPVVNVIDKSRLTSSPRDIIKEKVVIIWKSSLRWQVCDSPSPTTTSHNQTTHIFSLEKERFFQDGSGDGFALKQGQSASYNASNGWSGRIWGRTGCNFENSTNIKYRGPGSLPVSIVEFTLGEDIDYYDVSLVDGFNLPISIRPLNGKGNCSIAGCDGDLRNSCPSDLAVKADGKVTACHSACDVFNSDEYCCRGKYGDPVSCMPSNYSRSFKQVSRTSIITCSATEYVIAFCASRNQTVCSIRNNKVSCDQSNSSNSFSQTWWLHLMLAFPLTLNILHIL